MRKNWWKFIGIAILLYTVIVGMGVPLKPGITRADSLSIGQHGNDNTRMQFGETHTLRVESYNTHLTAKDNEAWLKLDSIGLVAADKFETINDNQADITFTIPRHFPLRDTFQALTLVMHNGVDGLSVFPSAISVRSDLSPGTDYREWKQSSIDNFVEKSGMHFPYIPLLHETVRNTFFHIPLWFSMFILLIVSLVYSIKYLKNGNIKDDIYASAFVNVSVLFGILGIITGSLWAKYTWGTFWTTDVKLNMSTVAMLIYVASLILRSSIKDIDRRAKISASYNIFAFMALIPLVFIIPRLTDSMHPGNGGNPALGSEDMENTLRAVFYPAIIGFTLLGLWMTSTLIRYELLKDKWMTRSVGPNDRVEH